MRFEHRLPLARVDAPSRRDWAEATRKLSIDAFGSAKIDPCRAHSERLLGIHPHQRRRAKRRGKLEAVQEKVRKLRDSQVDYCAQRGLTVQRNEPNIKHLGTSGVHAGWPALRPRRPAMAYRAAAAQSNH